MAGPPELSGIALIKPDKRRTEVERQIAEAHLDAARTCCEGCASTEQPAHNMGLLHQKPVEELTIEELGARYAAGTLADSARPLILLHAFRCPACQLDSVWDKRTDEWWVLDASDYGPQGSTDPRLF